MRLGQTSVVYYASKLLASLLGFVATVYIARILGPEPLGIYQVAIGLVSWLAILGNVGISNAVTKRVSEGVEQGAYALAGAIVVFALGSLVVVGLLVFRGQVANYVGYPATGFIILILLVSLLNGLLGSLLEAIGLVHLSGLLSTARIGGRAAVQIGLVAGGLGTVSLFIGHVTGYFVVLGIGAYFVTNNLPSPDLPGKRHFAKLGEFAKFSWLGGLQSRLFSYTDILVLRLFVSSSVIGVYTAAWNLSHFLILFSGTLKTTLFPEMSSISTEEDPQAVSRIVEQSLSFGGLFLIPGLLGGTILGDRILRFYGPEFPAGAHILVILILANLCMGYQQQLLNTLNAIDRPDLAFRVNAVFVAANVALNVALIHLYGWVGAAAATAASVVVSLVIAYRYVDAIIDFDVPVGEIGRQWIAAAIMAAVVFVGRYVEDTYRLLDHNLAAVVVLVIVGAGVYFGALFGLSREFRDTVIRNSPVGLPLIQQ